MIICTLEEGASLEEFSSCKRDVFSIIKKH
jgi:hypothetical protein